MSRTIPFIDLSDAFARKRSALTMARAYGQNTVSLAVTPPELEWRHLYDAAKNSIDSLERCVADFAASHRAPLGVSVLGEQDDDAATVAAVRACRARLAELGAAVTRLRLDRSSLETAVVAKNAHGALSTRLSTLVSTYRKLQVERAGAISGAAAGARDGASFDVEIGQGMSVQEAAVLESVLAINVEDVLAREKEMQHLAQSVAELGTMMAEIAQEVVKQGSIIDQIDVHMCEAVNHTRQGVVHLERANARAHRTMKRMWVIYAMGALILVLLIFVLKKFA